MQRTKKTEENKIKTRQQIKKGRSKRCCRRQPTWLIIAPLSYRYRSAIAPLSHRHRYIVTQLSLRCGTAIALPSFRCRSAAVAPAVALLSHRYHTGMDPLSLCCFRSCRRYAVAPLLSLLMLLRSRTAITPLSLHCRSAAVTVSVTTHLHCYRSVFAPLSDRYRSGPERV